jgi:hypothetical protein
VRAALSDADRAWVAWMRGNLDRAAGELGVRVAGEPVLGWALRSISAQANKYRLRVVTEEEAVPVGAMWTGNVDADVLPILPGLARPAVLGHVDWHDLEHARRVRGELMTLLPGRAVSVDEIARTDPDLPPSWWEGLAAGLAVLHAVSATRVVHTGWDQLAQVREVLGVEVDVTGWETSHGDLHWANLLTDPRPAAGAGLVDWELWGRRPAGYDAAMLLACSLAAPTLAAKVLEVFAADLAGDQGRTALVVVAARLFNRVRLFGAAAGLDEVTGPLTVLLGDHNVRVPQKLALPQ